jgi:nitrile hydratase
MNGVHDMGGMQGLGRIVAEANEPVFHARWEGRVLGLTLASAAWGRWNLDKSRHARESVPGAEYLCMSYYEIWFAGLIKLLVDGGLVTRDELASGQSEAPKQKPPLTADRVEAVLASGAPTQRTAAAAPRFSAGARIRARNIHPTGHTRLPRYARGKLGTITRHHGAHVFPDAHAQGLGEKPQHLYQVRFEASELWNDAQRNAVHIDLWEDYLEPA